MLLSKAVKLKEKIYFTLNYSFFVIPASIPGKPFGKCFYFDFNITTLGPVCSGRNTEICFLCS